MNHAAAIELGGLHDFVDTRPAADDFLADVVDGLARRQKTLAEKYFYDARGSRLFDRICELPEYYPTRTEAAILREQAAAIRDLVGLGASLVEFGSGSSFKTRILLDALDSVAAYVPVDISREHLLASAKRIATAYPGLCVVPVCADYTRPFALPAVPGEQARIGFFPGSTIGNFTPAEAIRFLRIAAAELGQYNGLLIGVDLRKDAALLHAAYNDSAGVTAAFNKNILRRINAELGGDFDFDAFDHEARWVAASGRIEMHLVSRISQRVRIRGRSFTFAAGESIHTENSYKYDVAGFHAIAECAGWRVARHWTDAAQLFSVHYLRVA